MIPGAIAETVGVVAGRGHVERLVVERRGEQALVEVAADDRHVAQGGARPHAQAASGATTPRRTASEREKSAISAGNNSLTCFCRSWAVAVMPM